MRQASVLLGVAGIAIVMFASPAGAQVDPPPWWRNQDNVTVSLCYRFDKDVYPPTPDIRVVPGWFPDPGVNWQRGRTEGNGTPEWFPAVENHDGVFQTAGQGVAGFLSFTVANQTVLTNTKHIWLQFDWFRNDNGSGVGVGYDDNTVNHMSNLMENDVNIGGRWNRRTITFDITPQPDQETISLNLNGNPFGFSQIAIDNVYFGANCTPTVQAAPEPGSIALFAGMGITGSLCALRRLCHRRKR